MTETASQVATQVLGSTLRAPMVLLPGWEASNDDHDHLRLRGPALFSGYLCPESRVFTPRNDPFQTADRVLLDKNELRFLGRTQDRLKIKGELVNLANLRDKLASLAPAISGISLVPIPHPRDETELLLVFDTTVSASERQLFLQRYQSHTPSLVRARRFIEVQALPRTRLGKLDEVALQLAAAALTPTDYAS